MAMERAELGLYFHLKAIGTGPLAQEFSKVVWNLDRMSASMGRMRGGIERVTKTLGIQSPMLTMLIKNLRVGEGLIRIFTGSVQFLTSVVETWGAVTKTMNMILGTQFVASMASALVALKAYIIALFARIGALWGVVKAELASMMATGAGIPIALATIGVIGAMIVTLRGLEAQTMKTSQAMSNLGDVSYKRSVFPEMLEWMRRVRKEASKPIEINLVITERTLGFRRRIGREIGEEVALELARSRRE